MKDCMQQMTLLDLYGHWQTKDGNCHIWIDKDQNRVRLFSDNKPIIDEPIVFEYLGLENMWTISKSVTLFMIFPEDGSIMLKIYDDKVVFIR